MTACWRRRRANPSVPFVCRSGPLHVRSSENRPRIGQSRRPLATRSVSDLPSYSRAPVVEVALAVQYELGTVDFLDVANFRSRIRSDFPRSEEQPARPAMEEVFDPVIGALPFRLEMLAAPPMPRYWFLSEDGSRLVQLQHDLLAVNWRHLPEGDEYPRYESLRGEIERHLRTLDAVLSEEGKAGVRPNWCEVTYINHVVPEEPGGDRPPLEEVLTIISPPRGERFLPAPEDVVVRQRFRIPGADASPRGRLMVEAEPATRNADRVPIWVITFVARLRAAGEGLEGALAALDEGREWAVRGFEEVISPEMQSQWGRELKE